MNLNDNNIFETSGTVSAVVNGKYSYIKFWQKYDFKGDTRSRLFTAWFDNLPDGINEMDRVTISGDLGAKVNTYTKAANLELGTAPEEMKVVEWSLNNCSLIKHEPKISQTAPADTSVPF
jgi:hypothetical protein